MRPGLLIRVNGVIYNHGKRFVINIGNGPNGEDRPFHLSVRPNENAIVRNNYQNRSWCAEERTGGCPIQYGVPFEIFILGDQSKFRIAINGRHFCDFNHRASVANSKYLSIEDDVQVSFIGVEEDPTYFHSLKPPGHHQPHQHQHHGDCAAPERKCYPNFWGAESVRRHLLIIESRWSFVCSIWNLGYY